MWAAPNRVFMDMEEIVPVTIISCRKQETDDRYIVVFSNEEKLLFSSEEVYTYCLYDEGAAVRGDFRQWLTDVLAKRMFSAVIGYAAAGLKPERKVRAKIAERFPGICPAADEADEKDAEPIWKSIYAAAADQAIQALTEKGYMNDLLYAERYAAFALRTKPVSGMMLRYELVQKGIAEETAESVLASAGIDDLAQAVRLLKKKSGLSREALTDRKAYYKLLRYLIGKGFSPATAEYAVRQCREGFEEEYE